MRSYPLRPTLVLLLACLLAVLFFLPPLAIPGAHFWGRYALPIVVVFLWGRRRDIYIVTALASVLVVAGGLFDTPPSPADLLVNHVLPLAFLWAAAWLLARHRQLQEELAVQRTQILRQQEELAVQAPARPPSRRLTFRNITAQRRSEARAHDALQRLHLAAEAAGIGIWNWNFADSSLEWDDRTCDLYAVPPDLSRSEISYTFWRARVHPDDLAQADPDQGDFQRAADRWSGAYRILLPGGAVRHILSAAIKEYDRDGRPLRMIGVNRDITDQVRYERLLQDTNSELEQRVAARTADLQAALADLEAALVDLQAANRLKDEFMAMISHELRTPLTGVLSLSELLQDQVAGPLNERQATYIRGIVTSGERLLYVINNILSYTHLLSGSQQLQCEPCDLRYLIHTCATSQRARAEAKQQVIEELVEPPGLSIESDAAAVGEVLKRLLDNAVKFTPEGGCIGLEAHAGRAPGSVQIVVWDTGPGVARDQLARIVKPFTQGDGSLTRGHEGIGMGLAYVDQMVRLLGGKLDLAANPRGGSCFTITLPQRTSPHAAGTSRIGP